MRQNGRLKKLYELVETRQKAALQRTRGDMERLLQRFTHEEAVLIDAAEACLQNGEPLTDDQAAAWSKWEAANGQEIYVAFYAALPEWVRLEIARCYRSGYRLTDPDNIPPGFERLGAWINEAWSG